MCVGTFPARNGVAFGMDAGHARYIFYAKPQLTPRFFAAPGVCHAS